MTTEPGTTKTTDPGTTKTTEIGKTETTAADKTTRQQTTQVTTEPTRKTSEGNKMHDCFLVIICNLISHCLLTCFYTFFIVITFLFIYVENRRE
jgi:hypothetical protein